MLCIQSTIQIGVAVIAQLVVASSIGWVCDILVGQALLFLYIGHVFYISAYV
jgi:hypothetical protein